MILIILTSHTVYCLKSPQLLVPFPCFLGYTFHFFIIQNYLSHFNFTANFQ